MGIRNIRNIHVYHESNPRFKFYQKKGKYPYDLTLGFENEIVYFPDRLDGFDDQPDQTAFDRKISNFLRKHKYIYVKEEYSNQGVEFNSHPFNWNWFLKQEEKSTRSFVEQFGYFHDNQIFYVDDDCGFHIHLARKFFNEQHLVNMVKFFFDPKHDSFLYKISRRDRYSFDAWSSNEIADTGPRKQRRPFTYQEIAKLESSMFGARFGDKKAILNLYPEKTIEIRMFMGTTNPILIRAYLEFSIAVSLFTKETDYDHINIVNFKKFVGKKREYKNLRQLISKPKDLYIGCQE